MCLLFGTQAMNAAEHLDVPKPKVSIEEPRPKMRRHSAPTSLLNVPRHFAAELLSKEYRPTPAEKPSSKELREKIEKLITGRQYSPDSRQSRRESPESPERFIDMGEQKLDLPELEETDDDSPLSNEDDWLARISKLRKDPLAREQLERINYEKTLTRVKEELNTVAKKLKKMKMEQQRSKSARRVEKLSRKRRSGNRRYKKSIHFGKLGGKRHRYPSPWAKEQRKKRQAASRKRRRFENKIKEVADRLATC